MLFAAGFKDRLDIQQQIVDFTTGFTTETTPGSAAKVADFRDHLRPGTTVYVTFLPGTDFADTIAVTSRLRAEGFNPVPHIAARNIPSKAVLEEGLRKLAGEAEIDQVLVIAGALERPLGEFSDSMQLLESGLLDKHGIKKIGVAGHPEGSPDVSDAAISQALTWKNAFADRTGAEVYIVTQFCFEAKGIIEWDRRIQAEGNRLPIYIGVPGVATIKTLLMYAKACGIGPSMTFLKKQARNVTKLLSLSAPDKLLTDMASYSANDPNSGIAGLHFYPLGGLRRTAKWGYAVVDGDFSMNKDDSGFRVDLD
jgi:methylenetetrahydrofolate reductase (NADPH)